MNLAAGFFLVGIDALAGFNDTVLNPSFTAPRTVTMDSAATVGVINFDSATSFTISGPGAITLDDSQGFAAVNVLNGSHTISAPLNLNDNATFVVMPAASTLTVSNLQTSGFSVTTCGQPAKVPT